MKRIRVKILGLAACISLLLSLSGCGLGLTLDFLRPDGDGGRVDISGGMPTEWGVGGYGISTTLTDAEVYTVDSLAEANAIIDRAIMRHVHSLTIDFTSLGSAYSPTEDALSIELSNHVSIEKRYLESRPHVVEFVISYHADAASVFTAPTEEHDSVTVRNGNMIARLESVTEEATRAENFDGFAIDSVAETLAVYNSEELWWALARGYRPTFPLENSKAETFYNEAKRILRHIVHDGMTDYQKLLAIYDYLVDAVEYDYDAYYSSGDGWHGKDACYYLEGVFESSRAVCDGKSKALVLFCRIEGIECVRDFGEKLDTGMGHAWNYVKLDGVFYLVDTTAGDVMASADGGVGEFVGDSVEYTDYTSLLLPVNSYADEYEYSGAWTSITEAGGGSDRTRDQLRAGLYGTADDFVIDRTGELSRIVRLITDTGIDEPFSLTVKYESSSSIHYLISRAIDENDYEYAVFLPGGEESLYFILFKPVAADTSAE